MTKAQTTQEKINKLDLIKILKICASKDNMKKVKVQLKEGEKIFLKYISGIYKQSVQNIQRTLAVEQQKEKH